MLVRFTSMKLINSPNAFTLQKLITPRPHSHQFVDEIEARRQAGWQPTNHLRSVCVYMRLFVVYVGIYVASVGLLLYARCV